MQQRRGWMFILFSLGFLMAETERSWALEKLAIAAASDLKFVMDELSREFSKVHPTVELQISYGSSGNFTAQILQGAPFDLFFSADSVYPNQLIERGVVSGEKFQYGVGQLVVWIPHSSPLDLQKMGMQTLKNPSLKKIAIANPRHAPFGQAALSAIKNANVYESVKDRLVLGDNVAQAAHFLLTSTADLGVIALSLARSPKMQKAGRYWVVPPDLYTPLNQVGVLLKRNHQDVAQVFRDFILSPPGLKTLTAHGLR